MKLGIVFTVSLLLAAAVLDSDPVRYRRVGLKATTFAPLENAADEHSRGTNPPAPTLFVTHAGVYTGIAGRVVVAAAPDDDVTIDHLTCDSIEAIAPSHLTITNCTITGRAAEYAIVVWRFQTLVIENNLVMGPGILFRDFSGLATSARARFNKGINIAGFDGSARLKRSFIQAADLHLPDMEIAWNWLENQRGQSATEDALSFMQAGGTPDHPALMHDNLIDGVYNWPVLTINNKLTFSGSGIMCYDPGNDPGLTVGGYSRIYNNIVLASENQAIVAAGGHDLDIFANRAVNDGSSTQFGTVAYQAFNWDHKTPAALFGQHCALRGNFSSWRVNGVRSDFAIDPRIAQVGNLAGESTEAAERAAWHARVRAAGYTIGPKPLIGSAGTADKSR